MDLLSCKITKFFRIKRKNLRLQYRVASKNIKKKFLSKRYCWFLLQDVLFINREIEGYINNSLSAFTCWPLPLMHLLCLKTFLVVLFINSFVYILKPEITEAATQRCSWEKVFWKYAANLHENTHAEVQFQ